MAQELDLKHENNSFSVSLVFPWIKGNMSVDKNFIRVSIPNTILGFIPAGKHVDNSPLQTVSNVSVGTSYKLAPMVIGLLLVLNGIGSISKGLSASILIVIGALLFFSGIKTSFAYERSGIGQVVEFPFFESNHVHEFESQIIDALTKYQDARDAMAANMAGAATIVDAIKQNRM